MIGESAKPKKRRVGRPKLPISKNAVIKIRINENSKKQLQKIAEKNNLSLSAYILKKVYE